MKPVSPARREQRGFALLIVFLMAAAVALMLYRQIPRVAFESQRDKEQLLIDRGEQYKRGIQLYFVAYKKYPTKMEDLEDTNHKRYLRRRYIDPMTGKEEWRLVHVNGAGLLTDSQVTKPPSPDGKDDKDKSQLAGNTTGAGAGTGTNTGAPTDGPPEVNAAVLRRPSDRAMVGNQMPAVQPTNVDPNNPNYPPITTQYPPITLLPQGGQQGAPGTQSGLNQPGVNRQGLPGQQYPGQQNQGQLTPGQQLVQPNVGQPQFPNQFPGQQNIPGLPGFNPQNPAQIQGGIGPNGQPIQVPSLPGQVVNSQNGGVQPTQFQQQPGGTPTGAPGAPPNPAIGLINDQLRNPRQPPQGAGGSAFNNSMPAGGLAGVASTATGPTIKVYKERSKYNEWEFIFDLKQGLPGQQQTGVVGPGGAATPPGGTPTQPPKQP